MSEKKNRIVFEDMGQCPHCKKSIEVRVEKEVISEPIKGEYQNVLSIEPSNQSTLDEANPEEDKA